MKLIPSLICLSFIGISAIADARDIDPSKYSTALRSFITDVVYTVEAGDRDKKFKKLAPCLVMTVHGDPGSEAVLNAKLKEFLAATGVTTEKPAEGSTTTCNFQVYFGDTAAITAKAADIDKQIKFKNGATYWKWWDDNDTVNKCVILVCTDVLKGPAMEDRLVKLLLGVFGLPSQSTKADNSCLSEKNGIKTTLQPLDIAVLKFLYESVPAGAKPAELNGLIREKWPKG